MKTKKLTPRNAAPVQRENTATVSRDGNATAPLFGELVKERKQQVVIMTPFAGDDAE